MIPTPLFRDHQGTGMEAVRWHEETATQTSRARGAGSGRDPGAGAPGACARPATCHRGAGRCEEKVRSQQTRLHPRAPFQPTAGASSPAPHLHPHSGLLPRRGTPYQPLTGPRCSQAGPVLLGAQPLHDTSGAWPPLPLSLVTVIEKARSLAVSESLRLADRGGPSPQRRAGHVVGPHGCALKVVPVIVHSAGDSCFRNPELPDGCGQLWPSARVPTSEFQSPSHGQDSQRTPWGQTSWREPKSFRLKQTKMK